MRVVTLTTDFGTTTPDAGALNGVIWSIAPDARVVELSHQVPPRDLLAAKIVLENSTPYFSENTVHLVLVGETLRTSRPIAARLGPMLFVGPDNGIITPLLEQAEIHRWEIEIVHANRPEFWQTGFSEINPARDVLASVAAHLAGGVSLTDIGDRINDVMRESIPVPDMLENGWRGQIILVDHFGNLGANIRRPHLVGMEKAHFRVSGQVVEGLSKTFGEKQPGELITLIDSSNRLSICVVNGSAADRLGARVGDPIEVRIVS